MTTSPGQILQYFVWLLVLIELILAAYLIYLNPKQRSNLLAGLFLAFLALVSLGLFSLAAANSAENATLYARLLAITLPLFFPIQMLVLPAILRPQKSPATSLRPWLRIAIWGVILLPIALTLIESGEIDPLWFSGFPTGYSGGFLAISKYAQGSLSPLVFFLNFFLSGVVVLLWLASLIRDRRTRPEVRRSAAWFLEANLAASIFFLIPRSGLVLAVLTFSVALLFLAAFAALAASMPLPNRRRRSGSLQVRLTILALAVAIPLTTVMTIFLTLQARSELTKAANRTLSAANSSINQPMVLWLDYNERALRTLVTNPNVIMMNSLWQRPLLREMAENYPYMTLVSVVDVNGLTKTRSDGGAVENYKDRYWFQNALNGAPITYETQLISGEKRPVLVVSMPIEETDGTIVGVAMFTAQIERIFELVQGVNLGKGGSTFIVDQRNILVAHSDPRAPFLANMSGHPAVKALRQETTGVLAYTDNQGQSAQSYISMLPNGWGVIALQTEAGLFEPIRQFQRLALTVLAIGAALITLLSWSTIRQALRPVQALTETATAISRGDLTRQASEESQDELGWLAKAFNQMTAQLRELISNLEERVADRTRALERRITQLQVTAEVAGQAAAIREPEKLLQSVTHLISERFGFDHTGIFLIEGIESSDPAGSIEALSGYAVLRAASSEGGQRMLARGHRLRLGRQGIVGFVAATGSPRIALDVGSDAVFFNNPDLPLTRSELALPFKVQGKVTGVLDVQSNQASAFSEEDVAVLQILADQLALAIENARLFSESQQSFHELETLYGKHVIQGWQKWLSDQPLSYKYDHRGISRSAPNSARPEDNEAQDSDDPKTEVLAPIELRGQRIGALRLSRSDQGIGWSAAEKELIQEIAGQLALSLENARLLDEVRSQSTQEELINQIILRSQTSLDLETMMQNAVEEIGRTLRLSRVQIRLSTNTEKPPFGNGHHHSPGYSPNGKKPLEGHSEGSPAEQEWGQ